MTFQALGINHHTAPLALRERVAFAPEKVASALQEAKSQLGLKELAILSTCNRTELYFHGEIETFKVLQWFSEHHHINVDELSPYHYLHAGDGAINHMMQVACGLNSLILGEPQILGQMKSAYAVACEAGTVASQLHIAFQHVFSIAKKVRTDTAIGENPVSVAYAAVSLAQQIFADLAEQSALLIGAGEMIELVARHLTEQGVKKITVANRTLSRAADLAERFGAKPILLSDIPAELHKADIVISSTASQLPILGKGSVEDALRKRKHKPMFMVDIAVPRDIEPQVAELDDVFLFSVDDLTEVIDVNRKSREDAAMAAREIINQGVLNFSRQQNAQGANFTIKALREQTEIKKHAELKKALNALQGGANPEQVLTQLANGLTNKFLHQPTTALREASADGRDDILVMANHLFALDANKPE
ncbi:glutamyl-tRNA reductase [Simiduia curdlanivorans]|uniref:Glutamyl-tRNA reductase n=1 Tax=Simiduia curdlanivorans TaxID=1492769 RepID=A0ABV8V4K2_9GAMM|nr:glutamyl-tRNA reductase [Simiduia curdlanivorans]MDN3638397.1 glutamyl-tRNA reductase [Simiduia curdlanivorans]